MPQLLPGCGAHLLRVSLESHDEANLISGAMGAAPAIFALRDCYRKLASSGRLTTGFLLPPLH